MSHFTSVTTQIKDEAVLRTCLTKMGYLLTDKKVVKGYRDKEEKVDLAVSPQGGYLIGFRRTTEGSFEIVADWWGVRGIKEKEFVSELKRTYAEQKTLAFAKHNRYTVNRSTSKEGTRLELVRRTY